MSVALAPQPLSARAGQTPGPSRLITPDQPCIDICAEGAKDRHIFHTAPLRRAAQTPFGTTVPHGFPPRPSAPAHDALPGIAGGSGRVAHGGDGLRRITAGPAAARRHTRFDLNPAARTLAHPGGLHEAGTVQMAAAEHPAPIARCEPRPVLA